MPDWQERITRETQPAIRVEHELRYRLAAPLVAGAALWCDLGCGTGLAARRALDEGFGGSALLVDVDAGAVATAQAELGSASVTAMVADLTAAEDLSQVRAALLEGADGDRCITCFEVVEHLDPFVPLVRLLVELAEEGAATTVLSVPNDAFWAIENPHHRTRWGPGAFEELRGLLPDGQVAARQLPLQGSAAAILDAGGEHRHAPEVRLDPEGVPSHFLCAFGPRAGLLAEAAAVAQVDLVEQRAWERQREANLASLEREHEHLTAEFAALRREHDELREWAKERTAQFDEWRRYIHELEDRLGIPRSGEEQHEPARSESGA